MGMSLFFKLCFRVLEKIKNIKFLWVIGIEVRERGNYDLI